MVDSNGHRRGGSLLFYYYLMAVPNGQSSLPRPESRARSTPGAPSGPARRGPALPPSPPRARARQDPQAAGRRHDRRGRAAAGSVMSVASAAAGPPHFCYSTRARGAVTVPLQWGKPQCGTVHWGGKPQCEGTALHPHAFAGAEPGRCPRPPLPPPARPPATTPNRSRDRSPAKTLT